MRIEITTDGGFTGRGIGRVTLDEPLPDDVARAVARARPSAWQREYGGARGADLVRYTMTVDAVTTTWVEGAELPEDLAELFAAAWRFRAG